MQTRLINAADCAALLEIVGRDRLMDLMIERLRTRCANHDADLVDARARDGFRYDKPALGLVEWMPTHEVGGPVVIKMVGYHPTNPIQRSIPSVIATSSMWDTETGHLVAIADATMMTAVRTGAASAITTEVLAIDAPITVGLVGLGAQAVTQLQAISRVRQVDRVIGFDPSEPASSTFADRAAFTGLPVEIVTDEGLADLVSAADVLVTCTSIDIGAGPVIPNVDVKPHLHINAVGADFPGKLELPAELVANATVFPDTLDQCILEGECQQVPAANIGVELPEIVAQADELAAKRGTVTVFDSTGWAVEDDVALRLLLELAEEHDLGSLMALESIPADPYNPYS